jgi:hypothetical protein
MPLVVKAVMHIESHPQTTPTKAKIRAITLKAFISGSLFSGSLDYMGYDSV